MKIEINPRGNGACPLCYYLDKCVLRQAVTESLENADNISDDLEMELVIYSCPKFREIA